MGEQSWERADRWVMLTGYKSKATSDKNIRDGLKLNAAASTVVMAKKKAQSIVTRTWGEDSGRSSAICQL